MPILKGVDLSKLKVRCEKPWCKTKEFKLHRHHTGHQYLFVMFFQHRHDEPRYREFVARYFEYRKSDVIEVCGPHHREIHEIYDRIIEDYIRRSKKPLGHFSWPEADELMGLLVTACNDWLQRTTPGSRKPWRVSHKKKHVADAEAFLRNARRLNP